MFVSLIRRFLPYQSHCLAYWNSNSLCILFFSLLSFVLFVFKIIVTSSDITKSTHKTVDHVLKLLMAMGSDKAKIWL